MLKVLDRKMIMVLFLLAVVPGCGFGQVIHPVATTTRTGQVLEEMQIPDTGKRADLPENAATSDIVAIVNTDTGGKITIKKSSHRSVIERVTGKHAYDYTLDEKAQEEAKEVKEKTGHNMVESPSPPWWKWPLIFGIGLIGAAIMYFIRPILTIAATAFSWFRKR